MVPFNPDLRIENKRHMVPFNPDLCIENKRHVVPCNPDLRKEKNATCFSALTWYWQHNALHQLIFAVPREM